MTPDDHRKILLGGQNKSSNYWNLTHYDKMVSGYFKYNTFLIALERI